MAKRSKRESRESRLVGQLGRLGTYSSAMAVGRLKLDISAYERLGLAIVELSGALHEVNADADARRMVSEILNISSSGTAEAFVQASDLIEALLQRCKLTAVHTGGRVC